MVSEANKMAVIVVIKVAGFKFEAYFIALSFAGLSRAIDLLLVAKITRTLNMNEFDR